MWIDKFVNKLAIKKWATFMVATTYSFSLATERRKKTVYTSCTTSTQKLSNVHKYAQTKSIKKCWRG